jgi:hypothetical protein
MPRSRTVYSRPPSAVTLIVSPSTILMIRPSIAARSTRVASAQPATASATRTVAVAVLVTAATIAPSPEG